MMSSDDLMYGAFCLLRVVRKGVCDGWVGRGGGECGMDMNACTLSTVILNIARACVCGGSLSCL